MTELSKKDVDFGKTSKDYARHRAGFPDSFFQQVMGAGFLDRQGAVLDLGTGTGTVARGLALAGFSVSGIDPSPNLLREAAILDRESDVQVAYMTGTAEKTGQPDCAFDFVTAGQCWHWFDQAAALAEIGRVLKPGGRLVVAYFDWDPDAGPVDEMYKLQCKHNPAWKSGGWPLGFYPQGPGALVLPGWRTAASFEYIQNIPYTHEAWRGRMRAYAGIGGSLPPEGVEAFDREFALVLAKKFPTELMHIPHKIWAESYNQAAL